MITTCECMVLHFLFHNLALFLQETRNLAPIQWPKRRKKRNKYICATTPLILNILEFYEVDQSMFPV